ncbi:MAG: universal stress protein [Succinivibrio sp.]
MRNIHNIMVVIEPKQLRQPALERGIALYKYAQAHHRKNEAGAVKITAVLPIHQESWNLASFLAVDRKQFEDDYVRKQKKWLNAFLSINAMGVRIEPMVIFSKEIGKSIVSLANETGCDILIKTAEIHGFLDSVIFTPLDWQMLRHSSVPVCIAKDHLWSPSGVIAVAVDLSSPEDELMTHTNLRLLREAQRLSVFTGCKIALINAVLPVLPPVPVDLPCFTPDSMYEQNLKDICKRALEFASRHRIMAKDCHIAEGALEDVIYDECRKLNPTALFIGTSARRGIASAFIGNICEKITDSLSCDVVVITPKTVMHQVPTSNPSKCY